MLHGARHAPAAHCCLLLKQTAYALTLLVLVRHCLHICRVMVYDPIVEGKLLADPTPTAAAAAAVTAQQPAVAASHHLGNGGNLSSSNGQLHQRTTCVTAGNDLLTTESSTRNSPASQQEKVSSSATDMQPTGNLSRQPSKQNANKNNSSSKAVGALRMFGMQATFAVSAAWHVLLYWLLTGTVGWQWPLFFLIQGPIVVLDTVARKAAKAAGVWVPRPMAVCLTNFLLIAMADPLLISPLVESGVVASMFGQARRGAAVLARQFGLLLTA